MATNRKPARVKGVLHDASPVGMPDATPSEVLMALSAIALESGVRIGRGGEYDSLADRYVVIGQSINDHKAMDLAIKGSTVGEVILLCRMMRTGEIDPKTGHLMTGEQLAPSIHIG
jgi:hypothetical protein